MAKLSHSLVALVLCLASSANAADVEVKRQGATLKLKSQYSANLALIGRESGAPAAVEGHVRVRPGTDTTLNGIDEDFVFDGITSVSVTVGGTSRVFVVALAVGGELAIKGDRAELGVLVRDTTAKKLSVEGGARESLELECLGSVIRDKLTIKGGEANDSTQVSCRVERDIEISLGEGDNAASLRVPFLGGSLKVKTGKGADVLEIQETYFDEAKPLKVDLGGGSNALEVTHAVVNGAFSYKGGSGRDELRLRGVFVGGDLSLKLGARTQSPWWTR